MARPSAKEFTGFYTYQRTLLRKARDERARELRSNSARKDGASFETIRRLLVDVHPDVARDRLYRVELPERPEHVSSTLVGELALVMWHEFLAAKSSVVCRFCGTIRLFPDPRPRVICGDPACVGAYRREYQREHPERSGASTERVKRSRARRAKRGTGHGKKTAR